jgi:hypothetical protein
MTQETYRFAYDEANAELREIVTQFELLEARKEQIEHVVEALKALIAEAPLAETASADVESAPYLLQSVAETTTESIAPESFPEPSFEPEPAYAAAEQSSDPFQRRIDNALRHGLGARESRVLPRALNGLLSRA